MKTLKENTDRMIIAADIKTKAVTKRLIEQGYKPYRAVKGELIPAMTPIPYRQSAYMPDRDLVVYFLTDDEYQKALNLSNNIKEINEEYQKAINMTIQLLPAYIEHIIMKTNGE